MNKVFWVLVWVVLSVFLTGKEVLASGFNLQSISSVNTSGRQISHWWYTGTNPTFSGEAPAGTEVAILVDGSESRVTADGSSNWNYSAGSLASGDHSVSISNNGSTISFTLTIGTENVDWEAVNQGTSETLPTVGIVMPTILLSSTGLGLVLGAKRLAKKN